jgi:ABC-type transport system involved in multi-copper enzyme maturation permease subunit
MLRGALLQVGYLVLFCGLAFWRFQRKDVLS